MNKITYLCFVILFCFTLKGQSQSSEIQRVRVDFVGPMGYTRHLLLAFTPDDAASDDVDYGYDALIFDPLPDELNWMIEDGRYVIQGVGHFSTNKFYPFGMFLKNSGEIKILLTELENFDTPIDVFIYDSLLDTYSSISDSTYSNNLYDGEYLNRFYIAFTENNSELVSFARSSNALSLNENEIDKSSINYNRGSKELIIKTNSALNLSEIAIYDILGKKLMYLQRINSNQIKIPLSNLNTSSSLIVSLLTEDGKQLKKHIIAGK